MPFASKHFQLEPLTDGVYAAIAKEGGLAGANAGLIDLGDRALLFDAFLSPQAMRDLMMAAQRLLDKPVAWAINSHWHADHVLGNQALPTEIPVIATRRTRELIAERIPGVIAGLRENIPRHMQELEAQLQTEQDPEKRQEIGEYIDLYRMGMEDLPTLTVRLPDQTFEDKVTFHGPARAAELITFGGGHTESDALLFLPGDQIAFVADLLSNNYHPWIGDGHPDEWLRIYDRIEALTPAVEVVVPGHGAVATPDAFAALRRYLPALRRLVDDVIKAGGTPQDAENKPIPAAFSDWVGPDTFKGNVRFLYERAAAESRG
jgi:glyoxylase-like metal-dependent hydrolase (beta-lactamase superfamily II)